MFKLIYLINNASTEKYVQQSRYQAESAFQLSRRVAIAGFSLLLVSVVIGVVSQFTDTPLTTAYLAGVGGVVTEFIAGVFFWMYNRTLAQINGFYQGLMNQQQEAIANLEKMSARADEKWAATMARMREEEAGK